MINRRRVVETYDPSVDRRGSGFLLSPSLVLTAAHCVPSGTGAKVAVRAERDMTFREDGTVRWTGRGECDLALIELAETHRYGHVNPVPFGRPVGLVNWQAVGFPWAQERPGSARPRTAAESASGRLDPLTGMRAGTYDVEITSGVPESRGPGLSPWGGMSGAAVFAEGALIAVLVEDPDRFGTGRLRAVPITRMLEESESTGLVAPDSEPEVEAVWAGYREVLARPYETLPSAPSPLLLLQYQYAALPFHLARADDLVALESWCEDDTSIAVALVEGVGGTGKTRLAAELCRVVRQQGWVPGFLIGSVDPVRLTTLSQLAEPRLVVVDAVETRANDVLELARAMSSQPQQASVQMLLLARSIAPGGREAAGWWRGLLTMRNPLQAAFLTAEHRTLTPLPTGHAHIDERRSIFRRARERFATLLRVPDSTAEPDDPVRAFVTVRLFRHDGHHQPVIEKHVRYESLRIQVVIH
jgi:Trypsin-like peptidase domain